MVTITVNDEKIEAETLELATKQAKKLERKHKQAEKIAADKRDIARYKAYSRMGVICAIAWDNANNRNGTLPSGYKAYPSSDKYYCKVEADGMIEKYTFETKDGRGDHSYYGQNVTHEIRDGAGFTVCFRSVQKTSLESHWNFVGVHDGEYTIVYGADVLNPVFESMIV